MIIRPSSSDQRLDDVWDRTLHIQLLDRLTQDGARLVFYDIVFDGPARDPAVDEAFAEAIGRNGRVVLGAALDVADRVGSVKQERGLGADPPAAPGSLGLGVARVPSGGFGLWCAADVSRHERGGRGNVEIGRIARPFGYPRATRVGRQALDQLLWTAATLRLGQYRAGAAAGRIAARFFQRQNRDGGRAKRARAHRPAASTSSPPRIPPGTRNSRPASKCTPRFCSISCAASGWCGNRSAGR